MALGNPLKGKSNDSKGAPPQQPVARYPLTKGLGSPGPARSMDDGSLSDQAHLGKSNYSGPSSMSVKDASQATDLTVSNADTDPVLKRLQAGYSDRAGAHAPEDEASSFSQTRKIDASTPGVPIAFGHRNVNASPVKVPAKLGTDELQPARKPR